VYFCDRSVGVVQGVGSLWTTDLLAPARIPLFPFAGPDTFSPAKTDKPRQVSEHKGSAIYVLRHPPAC